MERKKVISIMAVVVMLAVASSTVMSVEGATTLQITGGNVYTLMGYPEWAYSGGKLLWSFGQSLDATYERSWSGYTQHADNYGYYWGECVSSCKALSKNNVPTSQWSKGSLVVNGGISRGTVIATFFGSGGSYGGHSAILKDYIRDGGGNIIGFEVWDQNWYQADGMGVFGKHNIYRTGSGVTDADNYYVVLVP